MSIPYIPALLTLLTSHRQIVFFVVDSCYHLQLQNGGVSYDLPLVPRGNGRRPLGTTGTYMCNNGYRRLGSSSETCQTGESWVGARWIRNGVGEPRCTGILF